MGYYIWIEMLCSHWAILRVKYVKPLMDSNLEMNFLHLTLYNSLYVVQSNSFWPECFLHNNTYLPISVVPFKVVSLGLYTVTTVVMPPFEAFCEVNCF
jgi:hypothetical protein